MFENQEYVFVGEQNKRDTIWEYYIKKWGSLMMSEGWSVSELEGIMENSVYLRNTCLFVSSHRMLLKSSLSTFYSCFTYVSLALSWKLDL